VIVGIPRETRPTERRVSMTPQTIPRLSGMSVIVERGAGQEAGFPDSAYEKAGASMVDDAGSLYEKTDVILKVQPPLPAEAQLFRQGSILVSLLHPTSNLDVVKVLVSRRVTSFAMDLIPRISRAQPMDALSSQATISGYKAVLLAADSLPRLFPLIMTAAGAFLFALHSPYQDASFLTRYYPGRVPHGSYDTSLWSIATGLPSLSPYSVVELGFIVLLATPVLRVAFSVVLFATEGDRRYVYITAAVLLILLFSLFVTPFIPAFGGS
jgi:hypothetical protein